MKTLLAALLFLASTGFALAQKDPPPPPPPPPPVCEFGTVTVTSCTPDAALCAAYFSKPGNPSPCPFNVCTNTTMCAPPPSPAPPVRGR